MRFEVIITTYNRPVSVASLVNRILCCEPTPMSVIVVDSSDIENTKLQETENVKYIRSSHKNQPYQRYLGFMASHEEIVCFFDDDITITNPSIFEIILNRYSDNSIVGCNVKFINEGKITVQKKLNNGKYLNSKSKIGKFMLLLTGVPPIEEGKAWLAGMRGEDVSNSFTETFAGPGGLSFRRHIVPSLFDYTLFALFENKMAMGEDKFISLGALQFGKLAHSNETCIVHSENSSNYYQDYRSFARKELYSRLWLSVKYLKVKGRWIGWGYIHYYWFACWRLFISALHFFLQPKKANFQIFYGKCLAVIDTVHKPFKAKYLCPSINWDSEFAKDLESLNTECKDR